LLLCGGQLLFSSELVVGVHLLERGLSLLVILLVVVGLLLALVLVLLLHVLLPLLLLAVFVVRALGALFLDHLEDLFSG
jgi:hypothetical protein